MRCAQYRHAEAGAQATGGIPRRAVPPWQVSSYSSASWLMLTMGYDLLCTCNTQAVTNNGGSDVSVPWTLSITSPSYSNIQVQEALQDLNLSGHRLWIPAESAVS